jgi:hypothetical protein
VFLVDITAYASMTSIIRSFRRKEGHVYGAYDENADIAFTTVQSLGRRRDTWPFITDVVMKHPSFRHHSSSTLLCS